MTRRGQATLAAGLLALLAGCGVVTIGGSAPPVAQPATPPASAPGPGMGMGANFDHIGPQRLAFALSDTTSTISADPSPFRFTDIQASSGVNFGHVSGLDHRKLFPTAFGSGVGLFDADGDGRLDLLLATFAPLPAPPPGAPRPSNRFYRNLGDGRFVDATEASGLGFRGYCHGIIVGDVDNDGDPDVFLCNFGPNALFLNQGNGTFRDVSHAAGVDRDGWSLGGAMLDHDNDGDLDIYVARYGDWQFPRDARACGNPRIPLFCSPQEVRTVRHDFLRNNGDGTFTEVSESIGLGRSDGRGFAAVAADLNGDGRVDLFVTNDNSPNFLYLNRGDGTFEDASVASNTAYDSNGSVLANMGLDIDDADGDGRPEIFITCFQNEHITYYQNQSATESAGPTAPGSPPLPVVFQEASSPAGLAADSRVWVGWGCALADFDNDGHPDAFVATGHLDQNRSDLAPTMTYDEPPLLFRNLDPTREHPQRFRLSTRDAGAYFATRHVGRGAAVGDLDNDGDLDLVVNHMDGPPALLRNDTPTTSNAWIRLALVGTRGPRDAIGARVEVVAGGRTIVRHRKSGAGLESSGDPRVLIGLGAVDRIDQVRVVWPSGLVSTLDHPDPRRDYTVVEPGP